jgi:hypothetical protein
MFLVKNTVKSGEDVISEIRVNCSPLPNCFLPYFAEGDKNFGIFSSKRTFFFFRKKEGGLTARGS